VRELKELGYDKLSVDQYIDLRNHGVSADFIREVQKQGYKNATVDELIRMRSRGISSKSVL